MLDFEYRQIKGVICDILHLIQALHTAYLQHKNTILAKVFKVSWPDYTVMTVGHIQKFRQASQIICRRGVQSYTTT